MIAGNARGKVDRSQYVSAGGETYRRVGVEPVGVSMGWVWGISFFVSDCKEIENEHDNENDCGEKRMLGLRRHADTPRRRCAPTFLTPPLCQLAKGLDR